MHPHRGFTLIELLVVIAIIAILSVVVVLTLNPSEMLRRSRDSNRLSDMTTLSTAISHFQTDQSIVSGTGSLGTSNTVYVSIPDPAASTSAGSNCSSLGLLTLPAGYAYHCAGPNFYRKTDGTGWIPVNFSTITTGTPLGQLPTDPINTSSSRLYYTYTTNGTQFETTAVMESQNYGLGGANDQITNDGGTLASVYEKGSKLGLEPLDYGDTGLVGNWTFAEGTGTTAYDYSGNNATGSWQGTLGNQWSTTARVGPYAGNFDGTDNYVKVPPESWFYPTTALTVSVWFQQTSSTYGGALAAPYGGGTYNWALSTISNAPYPTLSTDGSSQNFYCLCSSPTWTINAWHNLTMVYSGIPQTLQFYLDGTPRTYSGTIHGSVPSSLYGGPYTEPLAIGGPTDGNDFTGLLDDVRIYNRALTAAQIAALYAGGK
jgi:prepilin-type N-terminal cleavage/methylation domain-containing protein